MNLTPTAPIVPPPMAAEMDAREYAPLVWTNDMHNLVVRQYRSLKDVWQHLPVTDTNWDAAEAFMTTPIRGKPRAAFKGTCNDFAPNLRRVLRVAGIPLENMALVVCKIVNKKAGTSQMHMVLAIDTTVGPLICCNLRGCWPANSDEWDNQDVKYVGDTREVFGRGRAWVDVKPRGLDKVLEG